MNFLKSLKNKEIIQINIIALVGIIISVIEGEVMLIIFFLLLDMYLVFNEIMRTKSDKMSPEEVDKKIKQITFQVKKSSSYALNYLPVGIVLYDDKNNVTWTNPHSQKIFHSNLYKKKLRDINVNLVDNINNEEFSITIDDKRYKVINKRSEKIFYFFDITDQEKYKQDLYENSIVYGYINLDNYEEALSELSEQDKTMFISKINQKLIEWTEHNDIILKSIQLSKYVIILNNKILETQMNDEFSILKGIRVIADEFDVFLTLSIGIAANDNSFTCLSLTAQEALEYCQSRGGDQACIITNNERKVYGGDTVPKAKKTRVRSRIVAQEFAELIENSEIVFIMGHENPDPDSLGSSIGVMRLVESLNKKAFLVIDEKEFNSTMKKLFNYLKESNKTLIDKIVTPKMISDYDDDNSLLVIVDVQNPDIVFSKTVLNNLNRKVVIDHHKRGDKFIENPLLIYAEPFSSSTVEIISELMQYFPGNFKITKEEVTVMLSGIIVDTNSFTFRTSSRTFDAASYLRGIGANPTEAQALLRENVDEHKMKAELIKDVEIIENKYALLEIPENLVVSNVQVSQIADKLLDIENIQASFVIGNIDEKIKLSARSLGDFNVQIIAEEFGGGGHHNNAAAYFENTEINDVFERIKDYLNKIERGVNINEGNINKRSEV